MKKTVIKLAAFLLTMTTVLTPVTASAGEAAEGYYHVSALKAANVKTVSELTSMETRSGSGFSADSLTLQPGETTDSINLNWYAPEGMEKAVVRFILSDDTSGSSLLTAEASVSELTEPTKLDAGKYTDTGKMACKATVSGLAAGSEYTYQVSNDGGQTWSEEYTYTTPDSGEFTFAFTSDPQIKEDKSTNTDGWNPSDGTNQTGWAKMMEIVVDAGASLMVSAGDQVEDQSWGKSSEYEAFFAPEEMSSIAYAPAVGNHDRHYMFADHFNLPNEMAVAEDGTEAGDSGTLTQVKTTFRGQNSGTSQSHGNYIQATESEISASSESNGVTPDEDGNYDFAERREMETKGNYYYLYNNVLFITLNTGAYPGGNDEENAENPSVSSASADNSEAEAIVDNFRKTVQAAKSEYSGQYDWIVVTHHKSTQTVAKHAADSDIENYVDAGFEKLMADEDVDFVLGGHDHVYSRSYVLNGAGERTSERLDTLNDPDGVIYLTGNCCSDMQYYTPFQSLDKNNNSDYPVLANGQTGSQAYLQGASASDEEKSGYLPAGNQEWNQEYSPSYALFDVSGNTISVKVYNLDGNSENPDSREIDAFTVTKNADGGKKTSGFENGNSTLDITQTGRYDSGMTNADGGVMEIVDYNEKTGWAYAINGQTGNLTAIPLKTIEEKGTVDMLDGNDIDVKSLVEAEGFTYGDMTSVAVSPDGTKLAAAIQAEAYNEPGRVALFACNEDGTLTFEQAVETGVQPDMVTFTPDGTKILTADEGEPREGYGSGAEDPKGTVTVIDTATLQSETIGFESFDGQRENLAAQGIVIKKETAPSRDFEPEYIAAADDTAYITLQEANAIAVLDLSDNTFSGIYSAGFEDYSETAVDIDKKDETYKAQTHESLMGIRMPDALSLFQSGGSTYLLTANEGDSREWGDYLNEDERNFGEGETSPAGAITADNSGLTGKVVFFDAEDYDGLNSEKDYLFGGRSFTLFQVTENGLTEVFTSGSDFEEKTAAYLPKYFNCSNDDLSVDDRSGKKGPEPETVTVGQADGRTYAFVTLERIGGIMVYDITDPSDVAFANYINSRDFSSDTGADDSPEGLKFISAQDSPMDSPLLMSACEVGGTVAVYELTKGNGSSSGNSSGGSSSGGSSSQDKTETVTSPDGTVTTTVTKPDGTVTVTVKAKDGSSSSTVKNGEKISTEAVLSEKALTEAGDEPVSVPMNPVTAGKEAAKAQEITITLKGSDSAKVEIPVKNLTSGTIALLIKSDGSEEIVKNCLKTENGISLNAENGSTFRIIDNSREFSDVDSSYWGAEYISFAASRELFNGTGENIFSPENDMTRAMILTVLARYEGVDTEAGSDWYEAGTCWAVEAGISDGSDLTASVTREQLATMLYRYAGSPETSGTLKDFTDKDSVSSYAESAMKWAVSQGLIDGMGDGRLNPQGTATRAQVAAILTRFISIS